MSTVRRKSLTGVKKTAARTSRSLPPFSCRCAASLAAKEKNGGASEPRAKPSTVVPISRRPRVSHGFARDSGLTNDPRHTRRTTRPSQIYTRTILCELSDRTESKSRTAKAGEKDRVATVRVSLTNEDTFSEPSANCQLTQRRLSIKKITRHNACKLLAFDGDFS